MTTHSVIARRTTVRRGNPSCLEGRVRGMRFAYRFTVDRHGLRPRDDKQVNLRPGSARLVWPGSASGQDSPRSALFCRPVRHPSVHGSRAIAFGNQHGSQGCCRGCRGGGRSARRSARPSRGRARSHLARPGADPMQTPWDLSRYLSDKQPGTSPPSTPIRFRACRKTPMGWLSIARRRGSGSTRFGQSSPERSLCPPPTSKPWSSQLGRRTPIPTPSVERNSTLRAIYPPPARPRSGA
jgi:hypothetical protein